MQLYVPFFFAFIERTNHSYWFSHFAIEILLSSSRFISHNIEYIFFVFRKKKFNLKLIEKILSITQ